MALPKISLETLTQFFNSRSSRDKTLLIGAGVCLALTADILLVIQPASSAFFKRQPELQALGAEFKELGQNGKNKGKIESDWKAAREQVMALDQRFALSNEAAAEQLSKLAQESGVKISSLTPMEKSKSGPASGSYVQAPIKINASAGLHALGSFLAKVENSALFFRVTNLSIGENITDLKNHQIEMNIECYQKT